MTIQVGDFVQALFNFPGEGSSDLALSAGDVVRVTCVLDDNWAVGQKIGSQTTTGEFPLTFVELLLLPSAQLNQKVFLVLEDYPAQQNGDLELKKGNVVIGTEPVDEAWWRGESKSREGTFPLSVVTELELDSGLEPKPEKSGEKAGSNKLNSLPNGGHVNDRIKESSFVRALMDVAPQIEGELVFKQGDLIEVIEFLDDDWFYGQCHSEKGLVYSACVEVLKGSSSGHSVVNHSGNKVEESTAENSIYCPEPLAESKSSREPVKVEDYGYRTRTDSSMNTHSSGAGVIPYGRVIYPFTAEMPDELSLPEGSIVTLIRHVNQDWAEGEVHGKRGIFPTNFIKIIVDCPHDSMVSQPSLGLPSEAQGYENCIDCSAIELHIDQSVKYVPITSNSSARTRGIKDISGHQVEALIPHSFIGEVEGGVSVKEDDSVTVIKPLGEDWQKVQTTDGQVGQVPRSQAEVNDLSSIPRSKSSTGISSSATSNDYSEKCIKVSDGSSESGKMLKSSLAVTKFDEDLSEQNTSLRDKNGSCMKTSALYTTDSSDPSKCKPTLLLKPAVAQKPTTVLSAKSFSMTKPVSLARMKAPGQVLPLSEDGTILIANDGEMSETSSNNSFKISNPQNSGYSSPVHNDTNIHTQSSSNSGTNSISFNRPETVKKILTSVKEFKTSGSNTSISPSLSLFNPETSPVLSARGTSGSSRRNSSVTTPVSSLHGDNATSDDTRKIVSSTEWKVRRARKLSEPNLVTKDRAFQTHLADVISLSHHPPPARAAPQRPVSAKVITSSSEIVQEPPSESQWPYPKVPLFPPRRTLSTPTRVESSVRTVPRRPVLKAVDLHSQTLGKPGSHTTAQMPQPPQRQPPRPASFPAPPKRPPPRLADLKFPDTHRSDMEKDASLELISVVKKKMERNLADIKRYEESRSTLQRSLLQAGTKEQEAAAKIGLEFVERQLDGLEEEKSRLEENLFAFSSNEARLEKAKLLAAQQADETEKREEEERKKALELKEKKQRQRTKVIEEILETEKDYLFSLNLCLETFLDGPKPPPDVDLEFILGNMEEIADVSQKLLVNLEICVSGKSFGEQCVGRCFIFYAEDMKHTYAPYCRNHDEVITAMERYAENPEISEYFKGRHEKMKEKMNVFDLAGVLIKPVQRILKYPLLLSELLKNTEDSHPDKEDIATAIKDMTGVAKAINEYKRRKDLVYKYKKDIDETFSDKLSKLNLHSIKKKSSRIRGKISTNFGIALQLKDEMFDKEEAKFQQLEKAVKIFLASVQQYLVQSQETMKCQTAVVDGIKDFYGEKQCAEMTKLHEVTRKLVGLFDNMKETMESVVIVPLNTLASLFNGPIKVIEKRFDKLLDYNSQYGKTENDKELQAAKSDYEAMNAQLLDELPKFYNLAFNMLRHCILSFVLARRDFMDQSLKEICALLELQSMSGKTNMIDAFKIRHTTAFDQISQLSFIPLGFNTRVDAVKVDRMKQKGSHPTDGSLKQARSGSQSSTQRRYLHQLYPASKLYMVTSTHNAVDLMDISLSVGTLVGVVKELDPMGNKERWYVDDGESKGFIPCNILTPHDYSPHGSVSNVDEEDDIISILSADDDDIVMTGNESRTEYNTSNSSTDSSSQQQQFYYALYDFKSRHANEASLIAGHPVAVLAFHDLDGNSEWWLVDSGGVRGYAPANYMASVPYG